jgi:predicted signal transduction protein with EAL and GGDEF domain
MKRSSGLYFVITIIATLLIILLLRWQGASLMQPATSSGILALEFADTPKKLEPIFDSWNESVAMINICLDFLFIAAYTNFFLLALSKAARQWQVLRIRRLSNTLSWLALLAAILDMVENLLMLQTLSNHYSHFSLQLTWYCATVKFLIVFLIVIYLLASMAAFLMTPKNTYGKEPLDHA